MNVCFRDVKVCCLDSEQPPLDRTRDELSAGEIEIDNFFSDPLKLKKFVDFLSLEEKKGIDKFNGARFLLFKVRISIDKILYILMLVVSRS